MSGATVGPTGIVVALQLHGGRPISVLWLNPPPSGKSPSWYFFKENSGNDFFSGLCFFKCRGKGVDYRHYLLIMFEELNTHDALRQCVVQLVIQPVLSFPRTFFNSQNREKLPGFLKAPWSRKALNTPAWPRCRNLRLTFIFIFQAYYEYKYSTSVSSPRSPVSPFLSPSQLDAAQCESGPPRADTCAQIMHCNTRASKILYHSRFGARVACRHRRCFLWFARQLLPPPLGSNSG